MSLSVREWLLNAPGLMGAHVHVLNHRFEEPLFYLRYGCLYQRGGGRKKTVMTDEGMERLLNLWVDTIARMVNAHTKDEWDAADFQQDELLTPLLAAPVKQLRRFAAELSGMLEADPRVPFWVWRPFTILAMEVIAKAPDGEVVTLKKKLAAEITDLVEKDADFGRQLMASLTNALQWRDEETLTKIKKAIQAGAKPQARGRQSCLFLCVGEGDQEVRVML